MCFRHQGLCATHTSGLRASSLIIQATGRPAEGKQPVHMAQPTARGAQCSVLEVLRRL
jgi:hypothetical protein